MSRATELDRRNTLYRNNIATVLVDQGHLREAFANLRAVHGAGAAYYNMGYLLHKKGQTQAALQHFTLALRADPSLTAARSWVEYLQRSMTQARLSQHPAAMGLRITSPPPTDEQYSPLSLDEAGPRRLPPTASPEPTQDGPMLPGIAYGRAAPAAPLPPGPTDTAIRPLPRVN